jgi:hypothetical protein
VLKERTAGRLADLETYYTWYSHREPHVQHFEALEDYQAGTWPRPRRIVVKLEINRHGTNRRFVVTNRAESPRAIYQDFYVQRGNVPERPIGELKNGLHADRLSLHRFRANALKLLEHVLAYALVVLHREATAAVPEVARAEVSTLRSRLWKVAAVVRVSVRRIWFHCCGTWPYQELWRQVQEALTQFVAEVRQARTSVPTPAPGVPM